MGRAGRKGVASVGESILLCKVELADGYAGFRQMLGRAGIQGVESAGESIPLYQVYSQLMVKQCFKQIMGRAARKGMGSARESILFTSNFQL
jgi:replicative superfamily II helicase